MLFLKTQTWNVILKTTFHWTYQKKTEYGTELKPDVKPETKLETILWSIECGFERKREC